ncbi:hypothetical protein [Ferruginivarius sediminum]|uniref:Tyr recombinase domain-containing protein n=1 Tax=Ferruginivarius sediminum TaxID=2661937 RepID=A0A369T7E9_9PROT|nr:hypothetical protein [Ferruginivarius sediminum]RDD61253.1 hypothetical protein DRB17_14330 [Ferruginivarius sediminum]
MAKLGARKSLRPEHWPAADRQAWAVARTPGDIFEPGGGAANWRPQTVANFENDYGLWLGWLATSGRLAPDSRPGERVTEDAVAAYIADLQPMLAPASLANRVRRLYTAMQLFEPERDWGWLAQLKARLRRAEKATKSKPEALTSPGQLYKLGVDLMQDGETADGLLARKRAVLYRDGLIIAILAARAPRRKNLAGMRINVNVTCAGGHYWLVFSGAETKQKRASEHRLPADLTPRIDRYLDHHRAVLANGPHEPEPADALWLTEFGDRLSPMAINVMAKTRTREALGVAIPPHRFRDCLATAWAVDLPEHVTLAGAMLDHSDPKMTEDHYNQAQRHKALQCLARTFDELRRQKSAVKDEY